MIRLFVLLINVLPACALVIALTACDYDVKKHESPVEPVPDPVVITYNVTAIGTCRADTGGAQCTDDSTCTETTSLTGIVTVTCFGVEWCAKRADSGLDGGCLKTSHKAVINITGLSPGEWIINQETTASDGITTDQTSHRVDVP